MKYRKKPVIIEAIQITEEMARAYLVDRKVLFPEPVTLSSASGHDNYKRIDSFFLSVETLEGKMIGGLGDWIITGVKGEKYFCKPDIFEATYEPVEQS